MVYDLEAVIKADDVCEYVEAAEEGSFLWKLRSCSALPASKEQCEEAHGAFAADVSSNSGDGIPWWVALLTFILGLVVGWFTKHLYNKQEEEEKPEGEPSKKEERAEEPQPKPQTDTSALTKVGGSGSITDPKTDS